MTTDMNERLCSPILDLEIKEAVFNMREAKAPGPNGFVLWPIAWRAVGVLLLSTQPILY